MKALGIPERQGGEQNNGPFFTRQGERGQGEGEEGGQKGPQGEPRD